MGRSIPSPTTYIDGEIRRIKRLMKKYPRYRRGLEELVKIMRRRRDIMYQLKDPEDTVYIPYLLAAEILEEMLEAKA